MSESKVNKSYATFGFSRSIRQVQHAFRSRKYADENMFALLQMLHEHENRMKNKLGRPLEDLLILEIGPGQGRERARYFGLKNTVIGMDLDIIPQGLKPDNYLRMLRENGFGRFTKTIGRKLIIGRKNAKAWAKVVGSKEMPNPELSYGDICKAVPEPEAFDIVMSWSVFEHLPDPKQALENVIRSLKPGGIFYISLHLYTSNNGHHDIRAFTGGEDELPLWSHLRPSTSYLIEPSSYLNNWRLAQWRRLFSEVAPEYNEFLETYDCKEKYNSRLTESLRRELRDYSDEELFTVDAIYLWKKPN